MDIVLGNQPIPNWSPGMVLLSHPKRIVENRRIVKNDL